MDRIETLWNYHDVYCAWESTVPFTPGPTLTDALVQAVKFPLDP